LHDLIDNIILISSSTSEARNALLMVLECAILKHKCGCVWLLNSVKSRTLCAVIVDRVLRGLGSIIKQSIPSAVLKKRRTWNLVEIVGHSIAVVEVDHRFARSAGTCFRPEKNFSKRDFDSLAVDPIGTSAGLLQNQVLECDVLPEKAQRRLEIVTGVVLIVGKGIDNTAGLHVIAQFSSDENAWAGTELYLFDNLTYPVERENVLFAENGTLSEKARQLAEPIDRRLRTPPARLSVPATVDKEIAEKLSTLGYLGD